DHQTAGEGSFKCAGEDRADGAGTDCDQEPWKTKAEGSPGRCPSDLFEVKTEGFEDVITNRCCRSLLLLALAQNFFGKQTDVNQADDAALLIHDWEREKFVEHEKFARVQNSRAGRDCNHAPNHDVAQLSFECGGK